MPYFYSEAEVDIDVDEFVFACNPREIEKLIKVLKDENHLDNFTTNDAVSLQQEAFNESLKKLKKSYFQLSNEDIETIQNIAKKH